MAWFKHIFMSFGMTILSRGIADDAGFRMTNWRRIGIDKKKDDARGIILQIWSPYGLIKCAQAHGGEVLQQVYLIFIYALRAISESAINDPNRMTDRLVFSSAMISFIISSSAAIYP